MECISKEPIVAVSVLMSVFREPVEWIDTAVKSILNQDFANFEFIIIDDCPDYHESKVVLRTYASIDQRIRLVSNSENIGLTKSLNKGLKIARGKYLARMDADDFCYPSRFSLQFKFMEENINYVVCGGQRKNMSDSSLTKCYSPISDNEIKTAMIFNSPITHPCVFIRLSILVNNDVFYDENFLFSQDYELWSRLLKYGKAYNLPRYLINYRISSLGQTANAISKIEEKKKKISQVQNAFCISQGLVLSFEERELLYQLSLNSLISKINLEEINEQFIIHFFSKLYKHTQIIHGNSSKFYLGKIFFKTVFYQKISIRNAVFNRLFYYGFLAVLRERIFFIIN